MTFNDHFSHGSDEYNRYRPAYPAELFAWLRERLPDVSTVWDCGCGTGQASLLLGEHFPHVIATDPSEQQIAHARPHPNIEYRIARAEESGLGDGVVGLVVVAQALHWFDLGRFYAEVRRVLQPGGWLVALTYNLPVIAGIDNGPFERFHWDTLIDDWAPERVHVDCGYADLPFPFERVDTPAFPMLSHWGLDRFLGYVNTWSGLNRYRKRTGDDPLPQFRAEMEAVWGDPATERELNWRLTIHIGAV